MKKNKTESMKNVINCDDRKDITTATTVGTTQSSTTLTTNNINDNQRDSNSDSSSSDGSDSSRYFDSSESENSEKSQSIKYDNKGNQISHKAGNDTSKYSFQKSWMYVSKSVRHQYKYMKHNYFRKKDITTTDDSIIDSYHNNTRTSTNTAMERDIESPEHNRFRSSTIVNSSTIFRPSNSLLASKSASKYKQNQNQNKSFKFSSDTNTSSSLSPSRLPLYSVPSNIYYEPDIMSPNQRSKNLMQGFITDGPSQISYNNNNGLNSKKRNNYGNNNNMMRTEEKVGITGEQGAVID